MSAPLVRAVVVNWNGETFLGACLDSLVAQDLPEGALEIVVVDNDSQDGSVELLRRDYPQVQVVQNHRNEGFAGGVNAGLVDLAAPYVALLNNDARLEPEALHRMVDVLEGPGASDVGAVTALILLDDDRAGDRTLVNSTGNVVRRSCSATDRDWLVPLDELDAPAEVFGFCGGAAVLRTAALDDVGVFDESLFLYYEDTDLSWRLRAGGWTIRYERSAVAWHQHSKSSDSASALFRYHNNRNALLVFSRYAPRACRRSRFRPPGRSALLARGAQGRAHDPRACAGTRARRRLQGGRPSTGCGPGSTTQARSPRRPLRPGQMTDRGDALAEEPGPLGHSTFGGTAQWCP
jgi:N-acetylglucosaminyl-diphospho-decaprenol L-rhamnosyltransferase